MRVIIICSDSFVSIDGEGYPRVDLSDLDPSIHAIQWYGNKGEVEIKDVNGRMVENREITSFDEYAFIIPLWEDAKARKLAKLANTLNQALPQTP